MPEDWRAQIKAEIEERARELELLRSTLILPKVSTRET
jgi:hypothetical protein